ncbi:hypothetical protein [Sphingomonas sp.]|uniref:hypothetical protein n=1 Tax=Sphingomonas sp. TaxID=28214 RepID=UPI000DB20B33|nr:hypothetical protein [Sphingomonas sp.]PZU08493.1 MAG: hypothetical protein DI605_10975 [Sphingomonas sp.]
MTDQDGAPRPLPLIDTASAGDRPASTVLKPEAGPQPASTKEVFGRGLLLILGEMAQLVIAFVLAICAIACCAALLVKLNDAIHFMGEAFVIPPIVGRALGGLLAHSATFLVICLLLAIFGIKVLDLVVRVLKRRARLAELGYSPR